MKAITKRAANNQKTKEPMPIDKWFAAQDVAVDKIYTRMRKKNLAQRSIEAIAIKPENKAQSVSQMLLDAATTGSAADNFRQLKEDGWSLDGLRLLFQARVELNNLAVDGFQRGQLDTVNHDIHLIQKMEDGKLFSRIVIDGHSVI
jgi:hypothetical protein